MSSFLCYFRSVDSDTPLCFGSFQSEDQVNGKLRFHVEVNAPLPSGGVLPACAKLTMEIPEFKDGADKYPLDYCVENLRGKPIDTHKLVIKFGAGSIIRIEETQIGEENDADVANKVKEDARYISARKSTKLFRVVISWRNENLVTEGFMNTLDISSISSVCGQAMRTFRELFKENTGRFELYVLDRTVPTITTALGRLCAAQLAELPENDGPLVSRFYRKEWDSYETMPVLCLENLDEELQLPLSRPQYKFQPETAYANKFELCIRNSVAAVEVYEAEKDDIEQVLATPTDMKAVNLDDKSLEYFGTATFSSPVNKKFVVGDPVYIAIDPKTFNKGSSFEKWRGFVCARPRWLFDKSVTCFRFVRPRKGAASIDDTRPYVNLTISSVKPDDDSDEKWWSAYVKSQPFKVQICCNLSDLTARCQIDGMAAFQLGAFQNYGGKNSVGNGNGTRQTVKGWIAHDGIDKEASFWCLKNAVPGHYVDYLGPEVAKSLLKILHDDDHRKVIAYLRKVPNGLGVIQGPAGTGKTWVMAQIVAAKHAAMKIKARSRILWKTIVAVPSNHPADVAAESIAHAFADHPTLKYEYVIRLLPSHRKQQVTASGSMSSKIQVTEWAESFINGLKCDEKNKKNDEVDEEETRETGIIRQHLYEVLTALRSFIDIKEGHSGILPFMERDDRFKSLKSTIGYQCLAIAGFENVPKNTKYNLDQFKEFNDLLRRFINSMIGKVEKLGKSDSERFAGIQKKLFEYVLRNASILVSTPAILASPFCIRNFQSKNLDLIFDEAGRVVLPEYAIMFASYRPRIRILLGDIEQLRPIVTVKKPYGCADEFSVSVMESLAKVYWPSVSLFYNRRSAAGLIDIPSELFYGAKLISHPKLSKCAVKHPHTEAWKSFLQKEFPGLAESAGVYIEAMSSDCKKEGSKSLFNLGNAALIINVIEKAVLLYGFQAHLFAIIATYKDQVFVYRDALRELNMKHSGKGFDEMNVETVDAYQGGACHITLVDFVVTKYTGFLRDSGRLNVATTRAMDGSLTVLRGDGLKNSQIGTKNWPVLILEEARRHKISLRVMASDKRLKHECVKHRF